MLTVSGGVIQKLVSPPFLIDGHRFSIRIYATVTQKNPTRVYLSSSFFQIYLALGNPSDIHEDSGFISNFHFQEEFNYLNAESFVRYLLLKGKLEKWVEYTIPMMGNGFREFYANEATHDGEEGRRYFEILGCDVVLDASLTPYFLECNRCMGFRISSKEQTTLLEELLYIVLYESETEGEIPQNLHYWSAY